MRAVLVQTHTSREKGKRSGLPQTQRHVTLQMASQTSLRITRLFPSRPGQQADDPEPSAWTRGLPTVKADTLTLVFLVLCPFLPAS